MPSRPRLLRVGALVAAVLVAVVLLVLAAFPWGMAKGMVERRLSARFGRPVAIASLDRLDGFGLSPRLAIRGLTIPQPGWAGPGDFVRLAEGQATLPVLPLLIGRVEPRAIVLSGLRLALVRRADGTTNWRAPGGGSGGIAGDLAGLTVRDGDLIYRDALRDRQAAVRFAVDPVRGLAADGRGSILGAPVRLAVRGPAPLIAARPWPFTARIDGPALAMAAQGTMDRPLDTDAMTFDVTARADDLKRIDAVIEAGLFGTQRVALAAHVRRDPERWTVTGLHGTVGSSEIAGDVATRTVDGRHKVTGRFVARALAFEDFASDVGRAEAAARREEVGRKLVPDLKVNLARLAHTDGRIDFRIDRIVSPGRPSALRAMQGTLTLDHQVLVVDPFRLDLIQGTVTGTGRVAQEGRPVPVVTLDLRLSGSSITALAGGGGRVTGTVVGHARLTGSGATIRAAVGNSDGRIGLVARDGELPRKLAASLGFDAGDALFAGSDERAGLRCAVIPLAVRHGIGTLDPALIVDTTRSQLRGQGTISFPSETLAIVLTGAPKHGSILRLPGEARIAGTIEDPDVIVPHAIKSVGNIFRAIGQAITGRQSPIATDADCAALAAAALR